MKRPIRILIAVALLGVALLALFALFARHHSLASPHLTGFHTPSVQASCAAGVTVNMVDYRPEGPNHLLVTVDGVVKADLDFGASYSAGYANPDPTKPHVYHVVVVSADGGVGNLDISGTIEACVAATTVPTTAAPTTAPPTTLPATTEPATTVATATTTAAVTTAPPATTVAPTTQPVVRTLPHLK